MTQQVGRTTRTPHVETVAVVSIVRRADQIYTVSPTGSRHSQVVEHDAPDVGDEGGQHCAVKRRHYENTRTPGKSARYTRDHSHRHQCGIWTVIASSLRHGCSDFIQRVLFGNVTNPRARPQILASNGLATKVI